MAETYTWQDDPIKNGAICDTDITNEDLMHLRYIHTQDLEVSYDANTKTLDIGTITDLPTNNPNGNYISNIKLVNGDIIPIGGIQFDGTWKAVETQGDNIYIGTFTANQTKQFSLSEFLPDDGLNYECLFTFENNTGAKSGNASGVWAVGGAVDSAEFTNRVSRNNTRSDSSHDSFANIIIPIYANDRVLTVTNIESSATSGTFKIGIQAYKRLGTNNDNNSNYISNLSTKTIGGENMPGNWHIVDTFIDLLSNISLAKTSSTVVDLCEYIPVDGYQYEAIFDIEARTGTTSGNAFYIILESGELSKIRTLAQITRSGSFERATKQFRIPIFNDRSITVRNDGSQAATNVYMNLIGFRRLGLD